MPFKKLFKKLGSGNKSPDYYEDLPYRDYDAHGNLVHEYSPETGFIDYTTGIRYPPNNRMSTSSRLPIQPSASAANYPSLNDPNASWVLRDKHGNVLKSYSPETGVIDHTTGPQSPPAQSKPAQSSTRTSTQNNYDLPFRDYDTHGNLVHEYSPEKGFIDYTQGGRTPQPFQQSSTQATTQQNSNSTRALQNARAPSTSQQTTTHPAEAPQKTTQPAAQAATSSPTAPLTKTSSEKSPVDPAIEAKKTQMQKEFDEAITVNYQTALDVATKMIQELPADPIGYRSGGKVYELIYKPSVALQYYAQGWEKTQDHELQKLRHTLTPSSNNQWILAKLQPLGAHIFKHLSGLDMLRLATTCLYLYELLFTWQPFWDTIGNDQSTRLVYNGLYQKTLRTLRIGWGPLLDNSLYVFADLNYIHLQELVIVSPLDISTSLPFIPFIKKCGAHLERLSFTDCSIPCNLPVTTIMEYCPRLTSLIQQYKSGILEYIAPGTFTVSNSLGPKYPAMAYSETLKTLQLSFGFIVDKQVILDILRNCSNLEIIGLDPVDYDDHDDIFIYIRKYCTKARWFSLSDRGDFSVHSYEQEKYTEPKPDKLGIYRVCLMSYRIKVQESVFDQFFKHILHTLEDFYIPCDGGSIHRYALNALRTHTPPFLSRFGMHGGNPSLQDDSPIHARQHFDETFHQLVASLPFLRYFALSGYSPTQNVFNLSDRILKSLEQCEKLEGVTFLNCIAGSDITHEGVKSWCDSRRTVTTHLYADCRIFHFVTLKDIVLSMTQLRNFAVFHNPVYQNPESQATCYCMMHGVSRSSRSIHLDKDMLQSCSDAMKKRQNTLVGFENVLK
ncbi:hypothetical protein BJV82DRAFT_668231 [Fennellomyces sp. T-0311]|nr:hypothetical protein BJV82DRAFT_668231 [Fennellomyces sp. T-0311]